MFQLHKKRLVLSILTASFLLLGSIGDARAGNSNGPGYWIVSTYSMPQEPGASPKKLNFQYYFKPVCGKMRKGTCSQMQRSLNPSAPTCIFVHGSYVGIDVAIKDANNTYSWIKNGAPNCPLNVLFLVWPSDESRTGLVTVDVTKSGIKATQNGVYLSHLIDRIPRRTPVSLIGHSHGTRTVAACLHYRGGGQIYGNYKHKNSCGARPIRVVFAAAAINHTWMNPNNRYGAALTQVDALLNIVNHNDVALTLYPLATPAYGRALAKTGVTRFDQNQLGPLACKIHELDATSVIGFRHTWPNYYGRPELARIIAPYVFFSKPKKQLSRQTTIRKNSQVVSSKSKATRNKTAQLTQTGMIKKAPGIEFPELTPPPVPEEKLPKLSAAN